MLTSLPKLVSNACICGVTALRVIGVSKVARVQASSKEAMASFKASFAALLLNSIGVFRSRLSYETMCGGPELIPSQRRTK